MSTILPQAQELLELISKSMPTFNYYNWSTRSVIRLVRQNILNIIQTLFPLLSKPTLQDGRFVTEIKTRGQQVYLKDLDIPVYLSWVWLKRDL